MRTLRPALALFATAATVALATSTAQARPMGDIGPPSTWPVIAKIVMHDLQPPVLDSPHGVLYAVSEPAALISVVSLKTNTVVDRIHTGTWLGEPAVNSPARRLFVPDTIANTVTVIDTADNRVIAKVPIGSPPGLPVVDATRHLVYVSHEDSPKVTVIDSRTNAVTSVIDLTASLDGQAAESIAPPVLDPVTGLMYVSAYTTGRVVVVDQGSNAVVGTIDVGTGARTPVLDAASRRLYVPTADAVAVIDTAAQAVTTRIPTRTFTANLVLDRRHRQLYACELLDMSIDVVDLDTLTISHRIRVGEMSAPVIDPTTNRLYVPIFADGVVRAIDTRLNRIVRTIDVHDNPERAAIDVGRQRLYLTVFNGGKDALAVIDLKAPRSR